MGTCILLHMHTHTRMHTRMHMPLRTHLRREGDLVEHHVRHLGRRCTHAVFPLLVAR